MSKERASLDRCGAGRSGDPGSVLALTYVVVGSAQVNVASALTWLAGSA
ncbi:hypothetical protein ACSNOI_00935 [Actinomadura kijaniata]